MTSLKRALELCDEAEEAFRTLRRDHPTDTPESHQALVGASMIQDAALTEGRFLKGKELQRFYVRFRALNNYIMQSENERLDGTSGALGEAEDIEANPTGPFNPETDIAPSQLRNEG